MSMVYIPDVLTHEIMTLGKNKSEFVREAIKEKLEMEKNHDS